MDVQSRTMILMIFDVLILVQYMAFQNSSTKIKNVVLGGIVVT
jgi:hypothetical protein